MTVRILRGRNPQKACGLLQVQQQCGIKARKANIRATEGHWLTCCLPLILTRRSNLCAVPELSPGPAGHQARGVSLSEGLFLSTRGSISPQPGLEKGPESLLCCWRGSWEVVPTVGCVWGGGPSPLTCYQDLYLQSCWGADLGLPQTGQLPTSWEMDSHSVTLSWLRLTLSKFSVPGLSHPLPSLLCPSITAWGWVALSEHLATSLSLPVPLLLNPSAGFSCFCLSDRPSPWSLVGEDLDVGLGWLCPQSHSPAVGRQHAQGAAGRSLGSQSRQPQWGKGGVTGPSTPPTACQPTAFHPK
jgi:hypothetical protein